MQKILTLLFVFCSAPFLSAVPLEQQIGDTLHWRNIGPYRGGRTRAIAGVPSRPNVFYMAQVNGGIFRSDDYGRTWQPIFDDQPTASIGALAVSLSNPDVVYAGSGEGLHRPDLSIGDGVYKSTDAGKTWTHLGLRDGQQITQIAVDPTNPDRLFVAVGGHPYGPNEERGIFRSVDGGKSFEKVLYRDENTGGADVQIDPSNPQIVYASLWESREGPWENSSWNGVGGGIWKSTDGGKTWSQLGGGLPTPMTQANLAISPSSPNILFAAIGTPKGSSLYRSEDAGATWRSATEDRRPGNGIGGGDLPVVRFDPRNSAIVYSTSIVCWRSTDGGKTWTGFRGAPGGDDYQNIWINPNNAEIILLGSDQGAIITVNGGKSWSSWYNQSTAQLYHVNADNAFPYRLCSGQQESGSVCIASRGNDGAITFRDWHPVGAEEYGYAVPDPLDPDIIYGGKLTRYDRRTAQGTELTPKPFRSPDFRMIRTEPIVFSPFDPHLLYFAANTLWQSRDRGDHWEQISPDLTRPTHELSPSIGKYRDEAAKGAQPHGVIYTIAPSPLKKGRIWIGTDDGLIQLTDDGGRSWKNVTPPQLSAWQKVSIMDASHFDADAAYAAINTLRLDDIRPHIFRTHDAGKTWQEIVRGIPAGETTNVVREDTQRRGLLFAGSERGVYVSFDDGDNWDSLRLNLPATSVRDLIVKDDDVAIGTHGRGFWILDNITPLRQLERGAMKATLFKPATAIRVRFNMNTDTPLPPDEPVGENPPDGAMIDYLLDADVAEATLEIKDAKGALIRRYSSTDHFPGPSSKLNIPTYWIRPEKALAATAGMHRFLWDLHYAPLPDVEPAYPISAVIGNTAPEATSPWVVPAEYSMTLTTKSAKGEAKYSQTLPVRLDPRVKASAAELEAQFNALKQLTQVRPQLEMINGYLDPLAKDVEKAVTHSQNNADLVAKLENLQKKLRSFDNDDPRRRNQPLELDTLRKVKDLFSSIEKVDAAPTKALSDAVSEMTKKAQTIAERWDEVVKQDLPDLNRQLEATGLAKIELRKVDVHPEEEL